MDVITDVTRRTDSEQHGSIANNIQEQMQHALDLQRAGYLHEGVVSAKTRIDRIDRAIDLLVTHQDRFVDALNADFGSRSSHQTKLGDVAGGVTPLKHAKSHVKTWMKSERRKATFPLGLLGARSRIYYQPLGVVGLISPWNFPVNLTFGPLSGILAAGNRVMIKPSEVTPNTSGLMAELIHGAFDKEEIVVFPGGRAVGERFSGLAFDHLFFTGAASIGKRVMAAAANNLVPVTLELGGKSPVIIGRSADIKVAAGRIMLGKAMNAGQICLAPDYVFVPEEMQDTLVMHCESAVTEWYPSLLNNPDYTSIINQRHFERLQSYLVDARRKGAEIVEINPAGEEFAGQAAFKIPPTLVLNPSDDMLIMQEEIFGPLLPIRAYNDARQVVAHINKHDRPLGLYYFGEDKAEQEYVLTHTTSGGVTVNDVFMHFTQEDLPFGGVGPSGMGVYHGHDGFKTFSHAKSVFKQSKWDLSAMLGLKPPFGPRTDRTIAMQIKR